MKYIPLPEVKPKTRGIREPVYRAIGIRIMELRADRNWSQLYMSRCLGCARSYLTQIEAGASRVQINDLMEICKMFGITIQDFFNGVNNDNKD